MNILTLPSYTDGTWFLFILFNYFDQWSSLALASSLHRFLTSDGDCRCCGCDRCFSSCGDRFLFVKFLRYVTVLIFSDSGCYGDSVSCIKVSSKLVCTLTSTIRHQPRLSVPGVWHRADDSSTMRARNMKELFTLSSCLHTEWVYILFWFWMSDSVTTNCIRLIFALHLSSTTILRFIYLLIAFLWCTLALLLLLASWMLRGAHTPNKPLCEFLVYLLSLMMTTTCR